MIPKRLQMVALYVFNGGIVAGILFIIVGVGSFITGKYSAGKFGPIYPGPVGAVIVSAIEIISGVWFFFLGIQSAKTKARNLKEQ